MTEMNEGNPSDLRATLSRRDLFRLGLVAGSASLATACGWRGGPLVPQLRAFSRVNDWVGEKLLSPTRLAPEYPVSQRTPERSFPTYARTRGFPRLADPAAWALQVDGLVRNPLRLTLEMLQAMPRI